MSARADKLRSWMEQALELARQGIFEVEPNPPVGALVVQDGEIVGRGFHPYYGGPHAEVVALREAGARARGATLVCTLEPCSTWGKTPPCADMLLRSGIRRLVVGCLDPNPAHGGTGLSRLEAAGIAVEGPVLRDRARALIERFARHLRSERPWVVAKWACTADGKIATRSGSSRWITGEEARRRVHRLRARVDAVAVGVGTVLADKPALTAREEGPLRPQRVVFDPELRCPADWSALSDGGPPVVIVCRAGAPRDRRAALEEAGARLLEVAAEEGAPFLREALRRLREERGIGRLLVEGGSGLLGGLFDGGFVDQVECYFAPLVVGGAEAPSAVGGRGRDPIERAWRLEEPRWEQVESDALLRAFVPREEEENGAQERRSNSPA